MEHKLTPTSLFNQSISVVEQGKQILIKIENNSITESVLLTKEELHSFIGTLLHVQQKLK